MSIYHKPFDQSDPTAPYINGNPAIGVQGSIPPAEALEHPQREIVTAIFDCGFTPSNDDLAQLSKAIRSTRLRYAADTGVANALLALLEPAVVSYRAGLACLIKVAVTNTGPSTIALNGLAAQAIVRGNGTPVQAGDLTAGDVVLLVYDGAKFYIESLCRSLASSGTSTYLDARSIVGSNTVTFTANGSWTVPDGVTHIYSKVWGGGGGGGGGSVAGAGATGGAGAGYAEGVYTVTPGQVIPVTVGAGGTPGSTGPGNGGNGGTSSVGSFLSATGGQGGVGATTTWPTTSGVGGTGVGGSINFDGKGGDFAFPTPDTPIGGFGGPSFGGRAAGPNHGAAGHAGGFPGGGGSGSSAAAIGGPGGGGFVIIQY